jgi:hypothetical protein
MSDVLQALLDTGALYLGLGAIICIVLGVGAGQTLISGSEKKWSPRSGERIEPVRSRESFTVARGVLALRSMLGTIFRTGSAHIVLLGPIRIA